jgi:hypothetical protein
MSAPLIARPQIDGDMVAHANKINDPAPVRGMDTRDIVEFPFEPADFRCRGKFLKSNAPPYRPVLALYCTEGARFDQIEHDRILCKRRPCRSVFGRHCHAWTVAGVAGTHGRGGFVGEPTFQRHAEAQVGAARKIFRLVDPIPQAADTAPRGPKREEEHLSCSASARDRKRLFGR